MEGVEVMDVNLDDVIVDAKWRGAGEHVVHVIDSETGDVVAEVIVNVTGAIPEGLEDAKSGKTVREEIEQMAFSLASYAASCVGEEPAKPKRKTRKRR